MISHVFLRWSHILENKAFFFSQIKKLFFCASNSEIVDFWQHGKVLENSDWKFQVILLGRSQGNWCTNLKNFEKSTSKNPNQYSSLIKFIKETLRIWNFSNLCTNSLEIYPRESLETFSQSFLKPSHVAKNLRFLNY